MSKTYLREGFTPDYFNQIQVGSLPDLVGLRIDGVEEGLITASLPVQAKVLAPNGFLHAASVIALADTAAGYGSIAHLPEGAKNFTTIELKSNFLSTALEGVVTCECRATHLGRNTHVWDAVVRSPAGKQMALFRCTQMILY